MTRDEVFAARLFAATYYAQNGRPPTLSMVANARRLSIADAYTAVGDINYRSIAQKLVVA